MATTPTRTRKFRIEFRQQETGHVMERWRASDSCSLVGVGSVGKSNLMQHLADSDIQKAYMKEAKVQLFKAIIIDPSLLVPLPNLQDANSEQIRCWAGYELLMHRLFLSFYQSKMLNDQEAARLTEIYQSLQNGSNPLYAYMGLRYFELGLELFMRKGIHIVFMFDEFEEMLKQLPVKFFLTLRGLRDANKKQLSYLTFTRSPLPTIIEREGIDKLAIEQFAELFTDNLYYVGPYSEVDAREMVDDLSTRNQKKYDEYTVNFLLWATGRFAGLLRAGFRALDTMKNLNASTTMTKSEQLAAQIAKKKPVRIECRTIWTSLMESEKYVLRAAAGLVGFQRSDEVDESVEMLVQKSLLSIDADNRLTIEPPVFRAFVISEDTNQ
jgi:hypothetical protein